MKVIINQSETQLKQLVEILLSQECVSHYTNDNLDKSLLRFMNLDCMPISIEKDENSLYSSISYHLFKSTKYYYLIRLGVVQTLLAHENEFRILIEKQYPFEIIVKENGNDGYDGNDLSIQALSTLLERPIYHYFYKEQQGIGSQRFTPSSPPNNPKAPLLIGYANNRFAPLLKKAKDKVLEEPILSELSKKYKSIELTE